MWGQQTFQWQELRDAYLHLVNHIVPGPQSLTYFIPLVLLPSGLMLPPRLVSHQQLFYLIVPITTACSVHAWIAMGGIDVISFDAFLWTLFFYAFNDPRADFKLVTRAAQDQLYPADLKARLYWIGTLTASMRMNGWKIGSARHDAAQDHLIKSPSRIEYTARLLAQVSMCLGLLCITCCYFQHDTFLSGGAEAAAIKPTTIRMMQRAPIAMVRPMVLGLWAFALLNLGYQLGLPFVVFTNWLVGFPIDAWSPHTIPPHYGSFTQGVLDHGLSGLWGTWWHQLMRFMMGAPAEATANALHLQHGSLIRYGVQLIVAFGLSGITHAGMVPPYPLGTGLTSTQLRLRVAAFFWLQPLGIMFEALVINSMLRLGIKRLLPSTARSNITRLLRLMYVVAFLSLTIPLLYDPFRELGWHSIYPPPLLPRRLDDFLHGTWIP